MSDALPLWKCEFSVGEGAATPLESLTVGSRFQMKCHGDLPVTWPVEGAPPQITVAKAEDAYALVALSQKRLDSQDAEFEVTSYKAGEHKLDYIRVVKGEVGFEVEKPVWNIRSVLKQGEPPKPYGPFGPFTVSLPMWILIAVIVAVLLAALFIYRTLRRRIQRRRMLDELRRHRTAHSPLHQFYRDARHLRRRINEHKTEVELKSVAEDLNREFRLYVLRSFEIPALDWNDGEVLADLRRSHRKIHAREGERLRKTLRELARLKSQDRVPLVDLEQLHRMSLDAVERLEAAIALEKQGQKGLMR